MDKSTVLYLFSLFFAIGIDAAKKAQATPEAISGGPQPKSLDSKYGKTGPPSYYGPEPEVPYPGHAMYGMGYGGGYDRGLFDPSFLVPILLMLGLGALLIPLFGTLMTGVFTSPVNTLVTGRRRRSIFGDINPEVSEFLSDAWRKVEKAFEKYQHQ